jgi:uncharacterized membrane protein YkgB
MRISDKVIDVDEKIVRTAARIGVPLLRISLGIVFVWFGVLKFVPGLSSADELAIRTMDVLSLHLVPSSVSRVLLAILETSIGIGLITGKWLRPILGALMVQMLGTATPLVLFASEMWKAPFVPTLEGQYIIKNVVLIAAGVAIAATVRGGGLVASAAALRADRTAPAMPSLPAAPAVPSLPAVPDLPTVPSLPAVHTGPSLPGPRRPESRVGTRERELLS